METEVSGDVVEGPKVVVENGQKPPFPDPTRPFWWLQTEPLRMGECPAGYRLPPQADYWCHEGGAEWVRVDRDLIPAPDVKPKSKPKPRKPRAAP